MKSCVKFAKFVRSYAVKQEQVETILKQNLDPIALNVEDVSGGCGTMFRVFIVSTKFEGKSMLQQHQLVQSFLKEEIGQMHGMTLTTKAASKYKPEEQL